MSSRVAVSFSPDHQRSADARVRLKLAAIAYADASHLGDPELAGAGLASMCQQAIYWYWSMGPRASVGHRPMISPETARELNLLRLAALAYACARHGSDACIELARDALHALCDAAVAYCEAVLRSAESATPADCVDRVLRIDA